MTYGHAVTAAALLVGLSAVPASAQAVAGPEKARPVAGDPGISSLQVLNEGPFRVLRDYAEPGATRRMHQHADATYHVFVLITGQLRLTVDGQAPVEVGPGEALSLEGRRDAHLHQHWQSHSHHRRGLRQGPGGGWRPGRRRSPGAGACATSPASLML